MRFAWWSAEESGLIGSNYYVDDLSEAERDEIALYLNFDMIGSPNYARFIDDGTTARSGPVPASRLPSRPRARRRSRHCSRTTSRARAWPRSRPTPFSGRSDYGRFISVGIPAGGLFTGAECIKTPEQAAKFGGEAGVAYDVCYHEPCDDLSDVSLQGLDEMTDAVAHSVITYAQNTETVNGVKGKGNVKHPATGGDGTGTGTGTGSGGDLHDDHDHVELDAA